MLDDLSNWLKEQIIAVWQAFVDFMTVLFLVWLKQTFDVIVFVVGLIPEPTFLGGENLGSIMGRAGPMVGWFIMTFRIGESLTVLGAAMAFYIVRRLATLGIW